MAPDQMKQHRQRRNRSPRSRSATHQRDRFGERRAAGLPPQRRDSGDADTRPAIADSQSRPDPVRPAIDTPSRPAHTPAASSRTPPDPLACGDAPDDSRPTPPIRPPGERSSPVHATDIARRPRRPATTTKTAARRSRPPPGRSPAPSHDRVPTTTRIRHGAHRWPTTSTPTNAADPDTKRTDAPAAPIPTAAPTHRPTPHAPHPRAPSHRPTRNPPPPTRHRRSHSASPPPPLILPADRHPPQPDSATTSELRHPRRPVAPPTQRVAPSSDSGPGVPVNSLPSWKAGDPHAHLASYPWTSPLTRQLHLDIATYPWTGQLSCLVQLKTASD